MNAVKSFIRQSTYAPLFRKTAKILRHFEETHRYEVSPEVSALRITVRKELKKSPLPTPKLDLTMCAKLKTLNTESILSILNTWGSVRPDLLPSTVFYRAFLKTVENGLWKTVSWNHLVQIMHFVGYTNGEKNAKSLIIVFLHAANSSLALPQAPYKDICIICEAAFRSSTGISSPNIRARITQILETSSDELTIDSVWLVMLIKTMVFSKFFDIPLLEKLGMRWTTSGMAKRMPFTTQCYVTSLFAHAKVQHKRLLEIFIDCLEPHLRRGADNIRVKDISMFLWGLSTLAWKVDRELLQQVILPYLMSQLNYRNLTDGLGILIQTCVSLWMLGLLAMPLINKVVTMDSLTALKGKIKNYRDLSRLALLVSIVEAECAGEFTSELKAVTEALSQMNLIVPSLRKAVEKRPGLKRICDDLRELGFSDVHVEFPVLVYVAGVSARMNKQYVHVDLLDLSQCLTGSYEPVGVILAKIRLFKLRFPLVHHAYVTLQDLQNVIEKDQWEDILRLQLPRKS